MNKRTVALALASAFAVVAGIAAFVLAPGATPPDTGEAPLALSATDDTDSGAADTAPADPTTTAPAVSVPQIGVRSGRLEDLPAPASPPTQIRIDGLGIDAPVVEIGVDADAAVVVPEDVSVAGWYKFGPAPGSPGSAVLTAHVDSAAQGAGAFFPLRDAEPGAVVTVGYADGSEQRFTVVGRRTYPKTTLPVEELFTREGKPVLTLITCGGAFDPVTRHYEENVVVFAEPVAG